jgi:protoheme IX farnesyltransferase
MPPLLGYAALAGEVSGWGWWLAALVFGWQFPHFFAIGWLHRADYARAGVQVLAAQTDARGLVGLHALGYALALVPVTLVPVLRGAAGPIYAAAMLVLGAGYALAAARFARDESERTARGLLRASLIHLPLALTAALVDPAVHLASPIQP